MKLARSLTGIIGRYTSGKSSLAEAIIQWLGEQEIPTGFVAETVANRANRGWEDPTYIDAISIEEYVRRYEAGELVVAYVRGREFLPSPLIELTLNGDIRAVVNQIGPGQKLGGITIQSLVRCLAEHEVLLTTVNLFAFERLNEIALPANSLPCIRVITSGRDREMMQRMRNVSTKDGIGHTPLGVESVTFMPNDVEWLNPLVQGVCRLPEEVRRQYVVAAIRRSFDDPLLDAERLLFHDDLDESHFPRTRGEILKSVLLRGYRITSGKRVSHRFHLSDW